MSKEYISQGIIPKTKIGDALHVAIATVYEMEAIISWNNRHLANLGKVEKINRVNLKNGYSKHLEILTPMEVTIYED